MEKLSDIEEDIRERASVAERHGDRETHNDGVAMFLRSIADRIEAIDSADAWRSLYTPGNAAAMREALEDMLEKINAWRTDGTMEHWQYSQLLDICDAALAAPARNCDVGTAEEQFDGFAKHCIDKDCDSCEHGIRGRSLAHCALRWAQTPYAEEGGAE